MLMQAESSSTDLQEPELARRSLLPSHKWLRAVSLELGAYPQTDEQVVSERVSLENVPLAVLTAGRQPTIEDVSTEELEEQWLEMQEELASLWKRSRHRVVDCGHRIQLEKPKVVIEEIERLLESLETSGR